MATVSATPAAANAAVARQSSMGYADIYGAADSIGPSAAVGGSLGYYAATAATEPTVTPAAAQPAGQAADLLALGHQLLDSPGGLAFVIAGGLLLVLWYDLAE